MPISSSPINRAIKRQDQGLSPGCRSMPGNRRGDNTTSLNNPAPGMKGGDSIPSLKPGASPGVGSGLTGGAGTQPRSSAVHSEKPERSDAIATAVEQHLRARQGSEP